LSAFFTCVATLCEKKEAYAEKLRRFFVVLPCFFYQNAPILAIFHKKERFFALFL
jgi:hypothetical protein